MQVVVSRVNGEREPAADAGPEQVLSRRQMREVLNEIPGQRFDAGVPRGRWRTGRLTHDLTRVSLALDRGRGPLRCRLLCCNRSRRADRLGIRRRLEKRKPEPAIAE